MTRSVEIVPAIMPRDLLQFQDLTVKLSAFAKSVHVDIMDGVFVPQISWPYDAPGHNGGVYRVFHSLKMEAHLMVADPRSIAHDLIRRDFSRIIAHYESFKNDEDIREALTVWQGSGVETGLSITANTPIEYLRQFEPLCDLFHVMTVDPIGHQGGKLNEALIYRVRELAQLYPGKTISVDGGMNKDTIVRAVNYGASRIITGSAVIQADDMRASYQQLQALVNSGV